jgi:chaperonin GroEL
LTERLARLAGGVAVISVGGSSAGERIERLHTTETALRAARAVIDEGVVVGGGAALLKAAERARRGVHDPIAVIGSDIVRRACEAPLRQLAVNAGEEDADQVIADVLKAGDTFGFNAETGTVSDLFADGIVDPAKAARAALQAATDAAIRLVWSAAAV